MEARAEGTPALTDEQQFLTLPQLARLWGVSRRRINQLVDEGVIPAVRWGVRYRVSRRWVDAQHAAGGGVVPDDPRGLRALLGGSGAPDAPGEAEAREALRGVVREAVRAELATLAGALAAVLHPPPDELAPRRRGLR
jgi:excisionase family DNA binding protein